jgi:hypothetical protein
MGEKRPLKNIFSKERETTFENIFSEREGGYIFQRGERNEL